MKDVLRRNALFSGLAVATAFALPQTKGPSSTVPGADSETQDQDVKLPNGKSQHDEILKAEHQENLRDAAKLVELSQSLKADLEKNDTFVLSMGTIKKTDDIEKLVKTIRSRMRH